MSEQYTVLLTNPIHPDGAAVLAPRARLITAPDTRPETLNSLAREADGIIVRALLPADIVDHAPRLRGMVRHGVGLDFIPVEAATAQGVQVANLPGSNAQSVAEYCLAVLMSLRRPLLRMNDRLHDAGWDDARGMANGYLELAGMVLGIVGMGTIGRRLASMARLGFGMTVIATSRSSGNMPDGVEEVGIDELFARSDAIALCCALTPETRGLVGARLIARMRSDAVLVNVSRGPVVDTAALVQALQDGAIGGAAIDVYDEHPLPANHPLFECRNTLLTPHVAGITASSLRAMSVGAAREMVRILKGESAIHLVNPDCLDAFRTRISRP